MFGYIKPCKPDLKLREYDAFRAVYCGLCHQLGKSFGPFARLTLSYDFTFLAVMSYAQGQPFQMEMGRCSVNPLQKVPLAKSSPVLHFTADAAVLMLYQNLIDHIDDSKGIKKTGYRLVSPAFKRAAGQAGARQPAIKQAVEQLTRDQRQVESDPGAGVDAAAEPTAKALSSICRMLSGDPVQQRVLERFGYLVGRFIYLCDALDDLDRDRQQQNFNPLVNLFYDGADDALSRKQACEYACGSINLTIGEAAKTCELLELGPFAPVIRNIIYLGMPAQLQRLMPEKEIANEGSL